MAAGFGSRFGGWKQLFSMTSSNYSILDFSIFDAIQAGFNSIVIIVNENTLNQFQQKYATTLPKHISVSFVIQKIDSIPTKFKFINRKKPWGTGQALLMLKELVNDKFAIINADDFYGKGAFKLMYESLFNNNNNNKKNDNFLIGYQLDKTLSHNGRVSRGECIFSVHNNLSNIVERKQIATRSNHTSYLEKDSIKAIQNDSIVSMNFWGFNSEILDIAEREFNQFLEYYKNDDSEFYITKVVEAALNDKKTFKIIKTNSQWFGITYKEDAKMVSKHLESLINKRCYPEILW